MSLGTLYLRPNAHGFSQIAWCNTPGEVLSGSNGPFHYRTFRDSAAPDMSAPLVKPRAVLTTPGKVLENAQDPAK